MTSKEYNNKKRECWEELWNDLIKDKDPVDFPTAGDIFEYVFPKAYALGKQEKAAEESSLWSRLTDEEKRELRCRYHTNECVISNHRKLTGDKAQTRAVARMRLLENLFGKENLKTNNND